MKTYWIDWAKATALRSLRTFAEVMLACIGAATLLSQVDWKVALSTSVLSAIYAILASLITGIPEVPKKNYIQETMEKNDDVTENIEECGEHDGSK